MDESTKLSKAIRGSLKALRREFMRCSNQYPGLYHELWKPHADLSDYEAEDVCEAFRKAVAADLDDVEWQEWEAPEGTVGYIGRFSGNGEGLNEFRVLAYSLSSVLESYDFRPADVSMITLVSETTRKKEVRILPPQASWTTNDLWLMLLYTLGIDFESPLLTCVFKTWPTVGEFGDPFVDPVDALTEQEGGVPIPNYPLHVFIRQPLFTASIAALDMILDRSTTLMMGGWPSLQAFFLGTTAKVGPPGWRPARAACWRPAVTCTSWSTSQRVLRSPFPSFRDGFLRSLVSFPKRASSKPSPSSFPSPFLGSRGARQEYVFVKQGR